MPFEILVFASGRGSNFLAIAKAVEQGKIPNTKICALFCNKPSAGALEKAKQAAIPTVVVSSDEFRHQQGLDRKRYETQVCQSLKTYSPDLVCLAGYQLVVGQTLLSHFRCPIINIHPSLLPKFKGRNAQQQAIDAGEKQTGCTVHFVDESLDGGQIIAQQSVPIFPQDTKDTLNQRLLPVEHQTYVNAIRTLVRDSEKRKN